MARRLLLYSNLYYNKILGTERPSLIAYWPLFQTPASQDHLAFNGISTNVNCGSGASLDDLHDNEFTVEAWVYINTAGQAQRIISKYHNVNKTGWELFTTGNGVWFRVLDNTGTYVQISAPEVAGSWMHVAAYFNDAGDRKAYVAVNGVWASPSGAMANPIGSDAADSLYFGRYSNVSSSLLYGKLSWVRISDNDRHSHGTPFTPPVRGTIPAVDANTVALWPMNEGYGSVAGDIGPNNNDGTITDGDWPAYPVADNFEGTATRDGSYTGVTLGNPGIGDGRTSPFYDGINDFTNIYSISLAAAFNGASGTLSAWGKVFGAPTWADGINRRLFTLLVNSSNYVILWKNSAANILSFEYKAGGVSSSANKTSVSTTGFFHFVITWDAVADEVRAYYNGTQIGATLTGLGVWAGSLSPTYSIIGAYNTAPATPWHGYLAHCALWATPLSPTQIAYLASV